MLLIDKFIAFEKRLGLIHVNWRGFYYWGYVRFDVFREIERIIERTENTGAVKTVLQGNIIKKRIKQIQTAKVKSPLRANKECEILFINHERRMLIDSEYKPIYFYSIIDNLDAPCVIIEPKNIYGNHYFPEAYSEYTFYFDEFFAKMKMIDFLYRSIPFKKEIMEIINAIENEFDVVINKEKFYTNLLRLWNTFCMGKNYYRKMMNVLKPKRIVEVVHYSCFSMPINEVAHEMGIPVFELQHGGMGYTHVAYNYVDKCNLPYLPDKILVYSKFWKETTRFPIPDGNVVPVGYPHMDNMLRIYTDIHKDKDYITILFISQRSLGRQISNVALKLGEALVNRNIKYKIIYKLHPNEVPSWKEDLPELAQNSVYDIEVVNNAAKNIYEYFAISDVQIGVSSTGIYEGLAFNLKTFILRLPGWEVTKPLCDGGYAYLVNDVNEILVLLNEEVQIDVDFWEHNAVENILHEIGVK